MKKPYLFILFFSLSSAIFSIDFSNAVCYLGFNSSSDDSVITGLVAKANELLIDDFTLASNISLINLSANQKQGENAYPLQNKDQYTYAIYGSIEEVDNRYVITLNSGNSSVKKVTKHSKTIDNVLDIFVVCDELYEELMPELAAISTNTRQAGMDDTVPTIESINSHKIHEWLFNDNSDNEQSHDFFWTGKLKFTDDRNSKKSAALFFNSASQQMKKLSKDPDLYNDFTISLWFSLNKTPLAEYGRLYDCMQWTLKTGYNIIHDSKNQTILFSYYGEDGATHDVTTIEKLVPNQWYNVVVTFKNGTSCLYLNGNLQEMRSSLHTITRSHRYISIGNGFDDNTNQPFSGKLDDILIYGKALTAQEVSILYNTF